MSLQSPTLLALRAATAPAHESLEQGLHIAAPGAGRAEYARHAAAFWGWLEPIERDLWQGWPDALEPQARAMKSRWLEEDIAIARADGYIPEPIPRRESPPFATLAERAGWGYVVEGSMLGAQVLLRRLQPGLAPWPARWLQGYGAQGGRRWRDFVVGIDQCVRSTRELEEARAGAVHAFETLAAWFRQRGVSGEPVIFSSAANFAQPADSTVAVLR